MNRKLLKGLIDTNYPTRRAFIKAFNQAGGELNEVRLSHQLAGREAISGPWRSAYRMFFNHLNR